MFLNVTKRTYECMKIILYVKTFRLKEKGILNSHDGNADQNTNLHFYWEFRKWLSVFTISYGPTTQLQHNVCEFQMVTQITAVGVCVHKPRKFWWLNVIIVLQRTAKEYIKFDLKTHVCPLDLLFCHVLVPVVVPIIDSSRLKISEFIFFLVLQTSRNAYPYDLFQGFHMY